MRLGLGAALGGCVLLHPLSQVPGGAGRKGAAGTTGSADANFAKTPGHWGRRYSGELPLHMDDIDIMGLSNRLHVAREHNCVAAPIAS